MKTIMKKSSCPKCKQGKIYNPLLKTFKKCAHCNGTGDTKVISHYERDDKCPYNCKDCSSEIMDKCLDVCIIFPAFNKTPKESVLNAVISFEMARLTLERLRFPDHELRLSNRGHLELIHGNDENPEPKKAAEVDAGIALKCYFVIGQAFRGGLL
jgi:hypothetical protein